jgi:hypothetical protein
MLSREQRERQKKVHDYESSWSGAIPAMFLIIETCKAVQLKPAVNLHTRLQESNAFQVMEETTKPIQTAYR